MTNNYSVKCDLCGVVQASERPADLTMTRFLMNVETKHACKECWEVLRGAFKAGIDGIKDPLRKIEILTAQNERLEKLVAAAEQNSRSAELNQKWVREDRDKQIELLKRDLEGILQKFREIAARYNDLMSRGRDLFESFGGFRKLIEISKESWKLGFWKTLAFFQVSRAEFMSRSSTIIQTMASIESMWPKDKQPPPPALPSPKGY